MIIWICNLIPSENLPKPIDDSFSAFIARHKPGEEQYERRSSSKFLPQLIKPIKKHLFCMMTPVIWACHYVVYKVGAVWMRGFVRVHQLTIICICITFVYVPRIILCSNWETSLKDVKIIVMCNTLIIPLRNRSSLIWSNFLSLRITAANWSVFRSFLWKFKPGITWSWMKRFSSQGACNIGSVWVNQWRR